MTNSKKEPTIKPVSDELLRKAVRRELNHIEPPPPEMMWRRIQQRIGTERAAAARRRPHWARLSAVAAALLVFVIGTVHLYNISRLTSGESDISLTDTSRSDLFSAGIECVETDDPPYGWLESGEFLKMAVPPPDSIGGHFILELAASREGPGKDIYDAAIYSSGNVKLFWVRATPGPGPASDPDLFSFLAGLSAVMEVDLLPDGLEDGMLHFSADGRPGLAWQEDSLAYALWVISGDLSTEFLRGLINRLPPGS